MNPVADLEGRAGGGQARVELIQLFGSTDGERIASILAAPVKTQQTLQNVCQSIVRQLKAPGADAKSIFEKELMIFLGTKISSILQVDLKIKIKAFVQALNLFTISFLREQACQLSDDHYKIFVDTVITFANGVYPMTEGRNFIMEKELGRSLPSISKSILLDRRNTASRLKEEDFKLPFVPCCQVICGLTDDDVAVLAKIFTNIEPKRIREIVASTPVFEVTNYKLYRISDTFGEYFLDRDLVHIMSLGPDSLGLALTTKERRQTLLHEFAHAIFDKTYDQSKALLSKTEIEKQGNDYDLYLRSSKQTANIHSELVAQTLSFLLDPVGTFDNLISGYYLPEGGFSQPYIAVQTIFWDALFNSFREHCNDIETSVKQVAADIPGAKSPSEILISKVGEPVFKEFLTRLENNLLKNVQDRVRAMCS